MIVGTGRSLLFLHWPLPAEVVRPLVPPPLTIDEYAGTAYVGLVPHAVAFARLSGLPRALGHSFLETRVRTYVQLNGHDPGIYLFSADASSRIAVLLARRRVGLPYFGARIRLARSGGVIVYEVARRTPGGPRLRAVYRPDEAIGAAAPGTLEHFLIERYAQHVERNGAIWTARVKHRPCVLQRAALLELQDELVAAAGLPAPGHPPALSHYVERVEMQFFPPQPANV